MMRKAAAVLTAICCLVAGQVHALGLGSLTLESSLNQPLRARIEIVDLGGVSPADIVVQMGSQQDFQRFNLERSNFFSGVNFAIERTAEGVFVVLTSSQSVREPYLSFILDTRWPSGRILSEHTVLLDLPVFSDARSVAEPINQPVSPVVEAQPAVERTEAEQPASAVAAAAAVEATEVQEPEPEVAREVAREAEVANTATAAPEAVITDAPESLEIQETDTLWEIAMRVRPGDAVSIQQTMLAIQRLNPDAFVNGNINRLRAGETLQIPDLSEIQSINQQQAVSEVSRQNQQADLNVQPLTAPSAGPSSLAAAGQQGQLRVLTAEEAEPAAGSSAMLEAENAELDARIQALENQLALQEEEADRSRLQQAELMGRLNDLDGQIAAAMEIIRLQDQQLAQLQESLAEAAVQASLQQEQVAAEPQEVAAAISEGQPVRTAQPSFLDSVVSVLGNNSMILVIVSVLVILLMVMLLMRRNRAVTAEGLEVEFEDELESVDSSDSRRGLFARTEPDKEAVAAVTGLAGALQANDDDDQYEYETTEEPADEIEETEQDSVADEQPEILTALADLDEQETDADEELLLELEDDEPEQAEADEVIEFGEDSSGTAESDDEFVAETDKGADTHADAGDEDKDITNIHVAAEEPVSNLGLAIQDDVEEVDSEDSDAEEVVDFELDTELDASDKPGETSEVVDFDIDDFLDEDEAEDEVTGTEGGAFAEDSLLEPGSAADEDQDIEFELDTDLDEEAEADSHADGAIGFEILAAESQESDGQPEDNEPDEVESLDFDLSDAGIERFDADEDSTDAEFSAEFGVEFSAESKPDSDRNSEIETFDFDLSDEADEPEAAGLEIQVADDDAEEVEEIEFTDDSPEAEADESDDVLVLDKEAANQDEDEEEMAELDFLSADMDGADDDVTSLSDDDEAATKLDLAYAYQKMGDVDGAKEILEEVIKEGNDAQINEAKHLIQALAR